MEWTIRPGTINLLCSDQELIPSQQKSTPVTKEKTETLWSRFKRRVRSIWEKVQPVIQTVTAEVSAFSGFLTACYRCKTVFTGCH